jgi:hypothetical protein
MVALLTTDRGTQLVHYPVMLVQRELLLSPRCEGHERASTLLSKLVNKGLGLPALASILIRYKSDFRRGLFNLTMINSGGWDVDYGPWLDGVAAFTHAAVSKDQMDWKQQRGPYFGALKVGLDSDPSTSIPNQCMSAWQLTTSTDDPKHARVREILHKSAPGLQANDNKNEAPKLILPSSVSSLPIDDVELDALVPVVGMNVFRRIFGDELQDGLWEKNLGDLLSEYNRIGAACAVGLMTGKKDRIGEVVSLVAERILETKVGQAMHKMAENGSPTINGDSFINMLAFGYVFAGQGGSSHLTRSALKRIRSNPAFYTPLWLSNKRAFLLEQARLDPPVTSYTSLMPENTNVEIMGKKMIIPKGTERQMFIVTANRDPRVFANPWRFDTTRTNLDQVLSWNGPTGAVGMGIQATPRGCPGHSVSIAVATQVIDHFRPKVKKQSTTKSEL